MLPVPTSYPATYYIRKFTFLLENNFKYISYKNKDLILHLDPCMCFKALEAAKSLLFLDDLM